MRSSSCVATRGDVHALAVIPLVSDDQLAGVIELFSTRRSHIPESVRRSLEAVANEISLLLVQVRLDEAARELGERYQLAVEA
ncbi:MAG: GAF domain-containing protein, partial [Spirochaetota bacterium]